MINRILKTLLMIKILSSYRNSIDQVKQTLEQFSKVWDVIKEK